MSASWIWAGQRPPTVGGWCFHGVMESTTSSPIPGGPAGVLAAANRMVATVDEILWAAKAPEEIVDTVAACQTLRAHLAAVEAAALAEVEDRKIAKTHLAWSSTGDWYTHAAGTHPRTGRRTVRHAKLLVTDRSATRDALRDGLVSPEQAAVIVRRGRGAAHRPPPPPAGREDPARRGRTAARHRPRQGRPPPHPRRRPRRRRTQGREGPRPPGPRRPPGRFLAITEDGAGGVRLRGRGTVEDAATLKAALLPLTKPAPAGSARGRGVWGGGGRARPRRPDVGRHDPDLRARPGHPPAADAHGARPRVAVTLSLDALKGRVDWSPVTDDGTELSPATARRLACDADVIPVVLGTRSEVLDVGRAHRLVTPALWRALVCRDRHCAFPGCTRPPVMGHAHHLAHWADGGPTSLGNLVLLCGHHHRLIHSTPWQVRLNAGDGRPEFLPPPKPGGTTPHRSGSDNDPGGSRPVGGGSRAPTRRHRPRATPVALVAGSTPVRGGAVRVWVGAGTRVGRRRG